MTTPNLNQLPPISDFDNAYVLAQQAHEQGFRGSTFADLYVWLKSKLDLLGLSNTAGLPETFPTDGAILTAANAGQWTILGPGTYHQPGYPSIEVAEGTVVFAQFDGTQYSIQREVEMPMQEGTDTLQGELIPKGKAVLDYLSGLIVGNEGVIQTTLTAGTFNRTTGALNTSINWIRTTPTNCQPSTSYVAEGFGQTNNDANSQRV